MFICECGKEFENQQSFLGHKANCETHLRAVGKDYWIGANRKKRCQELLIQNHGSLEEYSNFLSQAIKNGNKKRTDTVDYYVSHIDREEFVKEYIDENRPRSYMREKYGISDYMMDQLVKRFGCKKDKKNSAKLSWETKHELYPSDNMNNWRKGHETRIKNSGSLEASYKETHEKASQTLFERYGVYCSLNLDYLSNHRKKKFTGPNLKFSNLLDNAGIEYIREFPLLQKSFDFKVGNVLIEVDPTITHNIHFIPYGDYKGLDEKYHYNKSRIASDNGYRCIHLWDWDNVEKVVSQLKKRDRIFARKCSVKAVPLDITKKYLDDYHLQGCARDEIRIGLYVDETLVSVMTFGKPRYNKNYQWELIRYCSTYMVVGGAEKLFKYFVSNYAPQSVISYCDKSKFNGNVYQRLGFQSLGVSLGKHWYNMKTGKHITDNLLRQRGFDQLLGKEYGCFGKGTSNEELMLQHDFLPVIDAGQETFVWTAAD